jgi:hypothetical protein
MTETPDIPPGRLVKAENYGGVYALRSEGIDDPKGDWVEIRVPSGDADLAWRLLGAAFGIKD